MAELVHGIYRANRTVWLVGQIDGQEAAKGNSLPFNDLMTGAAAIEHGYAVLTLNFRHFCMIPGLRSDPLMTVWDSGTCNF